MAFFVEEARKLAKDPDITDLQRATLKYMLQHCIGLKNARTIGVVVEHLNNNGFDGLDIPKFQHSVLGWSRECNVYIASGRSGIYLIGCRADVEPMSTFYRERIAAENHRLKRLIKLTNDRWPGKSVSTK
jgi:hypothetical protein